MTTFDPLIKNRLTITDLAEMTRVDGDQWNLSHVHRLLKLIALIGQGAVYDETAVTIATYLHDWGAYPRYQQPGVEHALRSRQVAESVILPFMELE
jgi:HD superfamily phosphodiesterase